MVEMAAAILERAKVLAEAGLVADKHQPYVAPVVPLAPKVEEQHRDKYMETPFLFHYSEVQVVALMPAAVKAAVAVAVRY